MTTVKDEMLNNFGIWGVQFLMSEGVSCKMFSEDKKLRDNFPHYYFLNWCEKKIDFNNELKEAALGYWIEYNYSFSYGKRKENNETYEWLDE